jgi:hypothetical protein
MLHFIKRQEEHSAFDADVLEEVREGVTTKCTAAKEPPADENARAQTARR